MPLLRILREHSPNDVNSIRRFRRLVWLRSPHARPRNSVLFATQVHMRRPRLGGMGAARGIRGWLAMEPRRAPPVKGFEKV